MCVRARECVCKCVHTYAISLVLHVKGILSEHICISRMHVRYPASRTFLISTVLLHHACDAEEHDFSRVQPLTYLKSYGNDATRFPPRSKCVRPRILPNSRGRIERQLCDSRINCKWRRTDTYMMQTVRMRPLKHTHSHTHTQISNVRTHTSAGIDEMRLLWKSRLTTYECSPPLIEFVKVGFASSSSWSESSASPPHFPWPSSSSVSSLSSSLSAD